MRDYRSSLDAVGVRWLAEVEALVDAADPQGRVTPRSRRLCAGLSALATACHAALGGERPDRVARAAALLSLLTKVDDEVIDRSDFHGGRWTDRRVLRARTRAFLAPTLAAIRSPERPPEVPADSAPPLAARVALAVEVGRALRAIGGPADRLDDLVALVAAGWGIQEEAVVQLSAHPDETTDAAIEAVTGRISGAWLMMITRVGAICATARRDLTASERAAFWAWGRLIQRADGLADLGREIEDGLISTVPGRLLWRALGEGYLDAVDRGDLGSLYGALAARDLDLQCLPAPAQVRALSDDLAQLGEVGPLLRFIHGFLLGRYLDHPHCARRDRGPFQPFVARESPCLVP